MHGEPKRLEQIVVNLLSNALRYTDAGGSVRVVVRRDGDDALLEVTDTGIGIAPEDLPRVFTRFWRGEKSRSRDTGGAGIGLSIVKELVQAHGGSDLRGERARRGLRLPRHPPAVGRGRLTPPPPSGGVRLVGRLEQVAPTAGRARVTTSRSRPPLAQLLEHCGARSRSPCCRA